MDKLRTFKIDSTVIHGVQSLQVRAELPIEPLPPFGGAPKRGGSLAEDILVIPALTTATVTATVLLDEQTFLTSLLNSPASTNVLNKVFANSGLLGAEITVVGTNHTMILADTRLTSLSVGWDQGSGLMVAQVAYMGITPQLTYVSESYGVSDTTISPISKYHASSFSLHSAGKLGLTISELKTIETLDFSLGLQFITKPRYMSKIPYVFIKYPIVMEGSMSLIAPERGSVTYDLEDIGYSRQSLKGDVTISLTGAESTAITLGLKRAALEMAQIDDASPSPRSRYELTFRGYCYSSGTSGEYFYVSVIP